MRSRGLSDCTQTDWIRACKKLGLLVDCSRGKGSHCLVTDPKTKRKYTLQRNLHIYINLKIFKKLIEWGLPEEKIIGALR